MTAADDPSAAARTPVGCAECGALLAGDQRYCVECGTRALPLPSGIYAALRAIEERHRTPVELPVVHEVTFGDRLAFELPSPRAAAVAVLGTLGFGAALGAGNLSLASPSPLVLINQGGTLVAAAPQTPTPAPAPPAASSSGPASAPAAVAPAAPAPAAVVPVVPTPTPTTTTPTTTSNLPPVKHVFMIMMGEAGYSQTFEPGLGDKYLSGKLAAQGELLQNTYAVTSGELANEIASISGQGPTVQTSLQCPKRYAVIRPARRGKLSQVLGDGCVYPKHTKTLADQLVKAHDTWKAYVEGLGTGTSRKARVAKVASCAHPALGAANRPVSPGHKSVYVTWRNPFVYFRSVTSAKACATEDVGLPQLATDLKQKTSTPTFAYIVPGPCDDGSATPCRPNAKAGLGPADAFLRKTVAAIKKSAAYKDNGLIIVTFDQAPQTGPHADPSSCCNNPTFPNLPAASTTPTSTTPTSTTTTGTTTTPTSTTATDTTTTPTTTAPSSASSSTPTTTGTTTTDTTTTPTTTTTTPTDTTTTGTTTTPLGLGGGVTNPTGGGGQVGALLISSYVKAGSVDNSEYYNTYALLGSVEKLLNLKALGYAADPTLPLMGPIVFNNYAG